MRAPADLLSEQVICSIGSHEIDAHWVMGWLSIGSTLHFSLVHPSCFLLPKLFTEYAVCTISFTQPTHSSTCSVPSLGFNVSLTKDRAKDRAKDTP